MDKNDGERNTKLLVTQWEEGACHGGRDASISLRDPYSSGLQGLQLEVLVLRDSLVV